MAEHIESEECPLKNDRRASATKYGFPVQS